MKVLIPFMAGFVITALIVWIKFYHNGNADKIEKDLLDEYEMKSIKEEIEWYHHPVSDRELLQSLLN